MCSYACSLLTRLNARPHSPRSITNYYIGCNAPLHHCFLEPCRREFSPPVTKSPARTAGNASTESRKGAIFLGFRRQRKWARLASASPISIIATSSVFSVHSSATAIRVQKSALPRWAGVRNSRRVGAGSFMYYAWTEPGVILPPKSATASRRRGG